MRKVLKGSDYDRMRGTFQGSFPFGAWTLDSWNAQPAPNDEQLLKAVQRVAYACVHLNANAISEAACKLRLYRTGSPSKGTKSTKINRITREKLIAQGKLHRTNTANVEEVIEHPLLDLLWHPNNRFGQAELFKYTSLHCDVFGTSFWHIGFDGGQPSQLWVLPTRFVRPIKDEHTHDIVAFEYFGDPTNKKPYTPEEIVTFAHPNLYDPYCGLGQSPLTAVWQALNVENMLLATEQAILQNDGRISGILSVKDGIGLEEQKRLEQRFNQKYREAGNGGVLTIDGDTTFTPTSYTPRDLGYLQVSLKVEKDIARVLGVPQAMLEGANNTYATLQASRLQHVKDAVLPRLKIIEERLNHSLVPLFDPTESLWFAFDDPSPENQELKQAQLSAYVQNELMTINEARAELDLPPDPNGDRFGGPYNQSPDIRLGEAPVDLTIEPEEEATLAPEQITFALDLVSRRNSGEVTDETLNFLLVASGWEQAKTNNFIATLPPMAEESEEAPAEPVVEEPVEEEDTEEEPQDNQEEAEDTDEEAADSSGKSLLLLEVKARKGSFRVGQPEAKHGDKLAGIVSKFFKKQRAAVLGGLNKSFERQKALGKAADLPRRFVPLESWSKELAKESMPVIELLYENSGQSILQRVGASADIFDVFNPKVKDEAKKLALSFADSTNKTTTMRINDALESLRGSLAESLDEGERLSALTDRVKEIFDGLETKHAETIARTEASRSYILGAKEAAKESGVVRGMKWLLGPNPCDECEEIAASFPDSIGLDEDFGSRDGAIDDYATILSPPAHPGCFCSLLFDIDE